MIINQAVKNSIDEAFAISGTEFSIVERKGSTLAGKPFVLTAEVLEHLESNDEGLYESNGVIYYSLADEKIPESEELILIACGGEAPLLSGKLYAMQVKNLLKAYSKADDKNTFYRSVLVDDISEAEIYERAKRLHVDIRYPRSVFIIETVGKSDENVLKMVKELFYMQAGDQVVALSDRRIAVVKAIRNEKDYTPEDIANMLVDMAGSEAMTSVRVAYGMLAEDISEVSTAYKQASMALDIGRIFYEEKPIMAYDRLGVGRIIFKLPSDLCRTFISEVFCDIAPSDIDEETLMTVDKFFENNLNVSETARQLFVHRNTLVYRIEKLAAATGYDIRNFDDALTIKIALMVVKYMDYLGNKV